MLVFVCMVSLVALARGDFDFSFDHDLGYSDDSYYAPASIFHLFSAPYGDYGKGYRSSFRSPIFYSDDGYGGDDYDSYESSSKRKVSIW